MENLHAGSVESFFLETWMAEADLGVMMGDVSPPQNTIGKLMRT